MSLNVPPDLGTTKEHEFDSQQDEVFKGLGFWMGFVGFMMILFGILYAVGGVIQLNAFFVQGLITIAQGVCMIIIGSWLWGASRSFKMVATSSGMDITLLMEALRKLRSAFTMQGILLMIVIGLVLLGIIFYFVASGASRH